MNEGFSEFAEHTRKPELDRNRPAKIFVYAREKQQWCRDRVSGYHLPEAIDHLVDELEQYMTTAFENLPEITITSTDVNYTKAIEGYGSRLAIENAPLPLNGDAELLGAHELRGRLFGFHRGDKNNIRAYVSIGDETRKLAGGIYMPLLSVGVENSTINFVESTVSEKLEELGGYVSAYLAEYDGDVRRHVQSLFISLNKSDITNAKRLHESSLSMVGIADSANIAPQFLDALMEIIKLKLRLDCPHEIKTDIHHKVISKQPIAAYKPVAGPSHFSDVEDIQVGLVGGTMSRGLGLFFLKDETAVQIPVQYITSIYKTPGK